MKNANVLEARDVRASNDNIHLGNRQVRQEIEALLQRYPNIGEGETARIRNFLTSGSHMDVGLVTGKDELKDKVAAFRKAHRQDFRLKLHEIGVAVIVTCGPLGALVWHYLR